MEELNELMSEELQSYIRSEYERLREQAATYGELDKLISARKKEITASEKEWKDLLRDGLSKLFLSEMNSLPIQDNNRVKPFYLCDGKKCSMEKNCYRNGGMCRYTSDVRHAKKL